MPQAIESTRIDATAGPAHAYVATPIATTTVSAQAYVAAPLPVAQAITESITEQFAAISDPVRYEPTTHLTGYPSTPYTPTEHDLAGPITLEFQAITADIEDEVSDAEAAPVIEAAAAVEAVAEDAGADVAVVDAARTDADLAGPITLEFQAITADWIKAETPAVDPTVEAVIEPVVIEPVADEVVEPEAEVIEAEYFETDAAEYFETEVITAEAIETEATPTQATPIEPLTVASLEAATDEVHNEVHNEPLPITIVADQDDEADDSGHRGATGERADEILAAILARSAGIDPTVKPLRLPTQPRTTAAGRRAAARRRTVGTARPMIVRTPVLIAAAVVAAAAGAQQSGLLDFSSHEAPVSAQVADGGMVQGTYVPDAALDQALAFAASPATTPAAAEQPAAAAAPEVVETPTPTPTPAPSNPPAQAKPAPAPSFAVAQTQVPGTWVRPVNGGSVTSCFCTRWGVFHDGIDIDPPFGTPIFAVGDGVVISAGPVSGYGTGIYIQHAGGDVSFYGHMSYSMVKAGDTVTAGQQISAVGNEGYSTGPHLHFSVYQGGKNGPAIDPIPWLNARGIDMGSYNPNG